MLFPYVEAGQSRKGVYRGRLPGRPLSVWPLAAFHAVSLRAVFADDHRGREPETLIVLPRLGRLTEGWTSRRLEAFTERGAASGRASRGIFTASGEWRGGDGRRLIHWRSSARLGRLVVRQFERPRTRDVAVVLDLWQPEHPAAEDADAELAVSFAATVFADVCRKSGSNVTFGLTNAEPECVGGPASPAILQGLLERLATAESRSDLACPDCLPTPCRESPPTRKSCW